MGGLVKCKFYNLKKTFNARLNRFNSRFSTETQKIHQQKLSNLSIKKKKDNKWEKFKREKVCTQIPKRERTGEKHCLKKIIWLRIFLKTSSGQEHFTTDKKHQATDSRNLKNCKPDKYHTHLGHSFSEFVHTFLHLFQ